MRKINVEVEFFDELLGTAAASSELHETYIADKLKKELAKAKAKGGELYVIGQDGKRRTLTAEDADKLTRDEVNAVIGDDSEEKPLTMFPRTDDGTPFLYDYQWKGFFKDCCGMLRRADGFKSKKLKAYKKEIDGLVFVSPRKCPLQLPEGASTGTCQRPLRASTPQGERIALANSETVPAGTRCRFSVTVLRDELIGYVEEWLAYGALHGTGQWRNSGKGRFTFTATDADTGKVIASNSDIAAA